MYRLTVPANENFSVTFSYIGFDSLVFQNLNLVPGEIRRLDAVLKVKTTLLEQVEIISDADRRSVSVVDIQPRAAKLLPSAFGDFTRILSTLPGVVTTNELSSAYSVRHLGPLAIDNCELRQARKGATVAMTLCAGMWLRWS